LVEAGEEGSIQDQHLKYYLKLSEQIEPGLIGPQQMEWSARTNDERDNLRAAFGQAAKTNVEAGLYISGRLKNFWERFDNREGARWLAEFLQKPESKDYPLARAKALCTQGWLFYLLQQLDATHFVAEECLALYRAAGDQHGEVDGLILLGFVSDVAKREELLQQALTLARSLGDIVGQRMALGILGWDHRDFERAWAYWDEAIALSRQLGHWSALADTLSTLGFMLVLNGNIESAQKYLDESDLLFKQLNVKGGKGHLLTAYGQIALMRGEYEQARAYFQENARLSYELGSRMDYLWATARLGYVELRDGNINEARQIFGETLKNFLKDGNTIGVVFALEGMASLNITVGKPHQAAQLIGRAATTREAVGEPHQLLEQADADRDVATIVSRIGSAAYQEDYEKGCAMSLYEAVSYALDGE
jgi:tetratricopeptide (TPR) repeat protein